MCHFVSVSFEPFMYLPVPLPNAHIRQVIFKKKTLCDFYQIKSHTSIISNDLNFQVEITFISGINDQKPVMFLIELTHADSVIDLKKKLLSFLSQSGKRIDFFFLLIFMG